MKKEETRSSLGLLERQSDPGQREEQACGGWAWCTRAQREAQGLTQRTKGRAGGEAAANDGWLKAHRADQEGFTLITGQMKIPHWSTALLMY